MADQRLTLQEQLLLLCLKPRTGEIAQPHFRLLFSGAALAELMRKKRIGLELGRVKVQKTEPLGDRAIDDVFVRFGATSRPHSMKWWVRHLYRSVAAAQTVVAERLVERGILTTDEKRALWVVRWTNYPVLEPAYTQGLHRQLRAAILEQGDVAPELATLIALLHNGKALKKIFSATELIDCEQRIALLAASDPVGYAVGRGLADALLEEESERQRARHAAPVIIIGPGHPPRPRRPRRRWENTFPGSEPDENGTWSVQTDDETPAPV